MKRILYFAVISLGAVLAACDIDTYGDINEEMPEHVVRIISFETEFSGFPGTGTIVYEADGPVEAKSNKAWCTALKVKEGEISLSVPVNTSVASRSASVFLSTSEGYIEMAVTQLGARLDILRSGGVSFPAAGGTFRIPFSCPLECFLETDDDWYDYAIEGDEIVVTAGPNGAMFKSGTLTVKAPGINASHEIDMTQTANLRGQDLANALVGTEGTEMKWYFDPAKTGPALLAGWNIKTSTYTYSEMYIIYSKNTYINPNKWMQAVGAQAKWSSGTQYTLYWACEVTEGAFDDEIVMSLLLDTTKDATDSQYASYDLSRFSTFGGTTIFFTLTGVGEEKSKTYRIIGVDDAANPTELTLQDMADSDNWFTLSTVKPDF